jgi:WhiB family transcriptional regulator, redox-sensing transcriptional regulator
MSTVNRPGDGRSATHLLVQALSAIATDALGRWVESAACAGTDPEIFFPAKDGLGADARGVCRRCPVSNDCLAYALQSGEEFGIWGGLDRNERKNLRRTVQRHRSREHAAKEGAA